MVTTRTSGSGASWPTFGDRILRLSIFHFHKTSGHDAHNYLDQMVKNHHMKDVGRINQIETSLGRYINWCSTQNLRVADAAVNLAYELGFLELRGMVSRVDMTTDGYRAVLLGSASKDWQNELRMPLIQVAVASMYGRPAERTEVGVPNLDGSRLATALYSRGQIARAERKFVALGRVLRRLERNART